MNLDVTYDAYCGLYCGSCPAFLKTKKEVEEGRNIFEGDDAACLGCKSEVVSKWCRICGMKSCSKTKGFDTCADCTEYPCEMIDNFVNDPNWLYHIETPDYIESTRKNGKEKWLKEMKERWSCPSCSEAQDWYSKECPKCKQQQRGYEKKM